MKKKKSDRKLRGITMLLCLCLLAGGCAKPQNVTGDSDTISDSKKQSTRSETTENSFINDSKETTEENDPLPNNYEQAVASAYKRSVLYAGSKEMRSALTTVLKKAESGQKIVFAALGDSITFGAGAIPGGEWVSLVTEWLENLDRNSSNKNVTLLNAGIGGTEAVYGAARLERDVLSLHPDFVIVDFGTNDFGLPHGAEAYEGILTKLISAGIPVINSNVCPRSGNNIQNEQLPINQAYGVPQVSFRSAYHELSEVTELEGLRANDLWTADNVHPTQEGHRLLADLIIHFLNNDILSSELPDDDISLKLPKSVTKNGFSDAVLIENTSSDSRISVHLGDGWTADYSANLEQIRSEGWQSSVIGSSITFTTNSAYFYVMYTRSKKSGNIEVRIDGELKETFTDAYNSIGYRGMSIARVVMYFDIPGEHTVTLTLSDNPATEKDWCGICAVGASGFSS